MWCAFMDAFVSLAAMYYIGSMEDIEDRLMHMCKELQ